MNPATIFSDFNIADSSKPLPSQFLDLWLLRIIFPYPPQQALPCSYPKLWILNTGHKPELFETTFKIIIPRSHARPITVRISGGEASHQYFLQTPQAILIKRHVKESMTWILLLLSTTASITNFLFYTLYSLSIAPNFSLTHSSIPITPPKFLDSIRDFPITDSSTFSVYLPCSCPHFSLSSA